LPNCSLSQVLDIQKIEKKCAINILSDYVGQGVLFSAGADMQELRQMTARKVEMILKGAAVKDIPVEVPKKVRLYFNLKTAKALGGVIPEGLKKEAAKIVE
jgi:ABC-type uncharacterized transport system substrate-binding protein